MTLAVFCKHRMFFRGITLILSGHLACLELIREMVNTRSTFLISSEVDSAGKNLCGTMCGVNCSSKEFTKTLVYCSVNLIILCEVNGDLIRVQSGNQDYTKLRVGPLLINKLGPF